MREFTSAEAIPENFKKIGDVSTSGHDTLDDVTAALSAKAAKLGGDAFKVISAGGQNKMFGNAIVYKAQ